MPDAAPPPPGGAVTRPTALSEWTVIGMILLAFALVAYIVATLTHQRDFDPHVVMWVGIALICLIALLILIALAFASPFLGTVKVTAGPAGVNAEIEGGDAPPPPRV